MLTVEKKKSKTKTRRRKDKAKGKEKEGRREREGERKREKKEKGNCAFPATPSNSMPSTNCAYRKKNQEKKKGRKSIPSR